MTLKLDTAPKIKSSSNCFTYINNTLNDPSYIESQLDKVTPELHYCIVGSMAAVHSIARDWFNNGMKESETEMADLCLHFAWLTQHEIKIKQKESI